MRYGREAQFSQVCELLPECTITIGWWNLPEWFPDRMLRKTGGNWRKNGVLPLQYVYNEGITNAVRRTVYMRDLVALFQSKKK